MKDPLQELEIRLRPSGFRLIPSKPNTICKAILKRQTFNTNRAVAILEMDSLPDSLTELLPKIKKEAASRCGYFPLFYGLGTQVVIHVSGQPPNPMNLDPYVDKVDNQWSIIQSIFIFHSEVGLVSSARTWGQFVTGKYQDIIASVLKSEKES